MTQLQSLNSIGKYRHLVKSSLGSNEHYTVAVGRPDDKQNRCRTGDECECEELRLRRGSPLAYGVISVRGMCFVSSSSIHRIDHANTVAHQSNVVKCRVYSVEHRNALWHLDSTN